MTAIATAAAATIFDQMTLDADRNCDLQLRRIKNRLRSLPPGSSLIYHIGTLAIDRERSTPLGRATAKLADHVLAMQRDGHGYLVQRRMDGGTAYIFRAAGV